MYEYAINFETVFGSPAYVIRRMSDNAAVSFWRSESEAVDYIRRVSWGLDTTRIPVPDPECYGCLGTGRVQWARVKPVECPCCSCSVCGSSADYRRTDEGRVFCVDCFPA